MERIPILKMGSLLLVTIQVDMHDRLAMTLQDDLTTRIVKDRAKGVLIDISALDLVDSFIGRMINNIAAMAKILDAGRHAACRCHYLGGTRSDAGRRQDRPER
jgi:rsbT antagonist protein RsbS